jgi:Uma2 family endonuclease
MPAEARRIDVATLTPAALPDLYEVVNGEIVDKTTVGVRQVNIASRIFYFLCVFALPKRLGQPAIEALFHLHNDSPERRPDVAFVADSRWPFDLEAPEGNSWPVVPNLAVEVISPSNTYNEIRQKIQEYFAAGVELVWVVSTDLRQVEAFTAAGGYQLVTLDQNLKGDPVLPGFELPLRDLFSKRSQ